MLRVTRFLERRHASRIAVNAWSKMKSEIAFSVTRPSEPSVRCAAQPAVHSRPVNWLSATTGHSLMASNSNV